MKLKLTIMLFILTSATNAYSLDKSLYAQGEKLSKICVICHGENGRAANSLIPHLAGQNEAYLAKQLNDFRGRRRFNSAMRQIAISLKDDEIEALAHYFSNLSPTFSAIAPENTKP